MAKPLDERTAAAMGNGARATTVSELIDEITSAIEAATAEKAEQDELAISLTISDTEAEAAATSATRLGRRIARLTGQQGLLRERLEELLTSERRKQLEADHAAIKTERDELAADLATYWPELQGAMITLLARLKTSNDRCSQINKRRAFGLPELISAEVEARGSTGLYFHPQLLGLRMTSILEMQLPHFHARDWSADGAPAWPPKEGTFVDSGMGEAFAAMDRAYHARREWIFPGTTKAEVA